ncbi:hypothetical protein B1A_18556, partial [mine drainage metagenome]
FSAFAAEVWVNATKPYDLNAVIDALNRYCATSDTGQFCPKPADVSKMLRGSTKDAAVVAWGRVDRAMKTVGVYRSVVFDDPIIHRTIYDLGGWISLGNKTEKEWEFVGRDFQIAYRGYMNSGMKADFPNTLVGIADAKNAIGGFGDVPDPVMIGDAERAKKVFLSGNGGNIETFAPLSSVMDINSLGAPGEPRR